MFPTVMGLVKRVEIDDKFPDEGNSGFKKLRISLYTRQYIGKDKYDHLFVTCYYSCSEARAEAAMNIKKDSILVCPVERIVNATTTKPESEGEQTKHNLYVKISDYRFGPYIGVSSEESAGAQSSGGQNRGQQTRPAQAGRRPAPKAPPKDNDFDIDSPDHDPFDDKSQKGMAGDIWE